LKDISVFKNKSMDYDKKMFYFLVDDALFWRVAGEGTRGVLRPLLSISSSVLFTRSAFVKREEEALLGEGVPWSSFSLSVVNMLCNSSSRNMLLESSKKCESSSVSSNKLGL
jgi:hypothetical protein